MVTGLPFGWEERVFKTKPAGKTAFLDTCETAADKQRLTDCVPGFVSDLVTHLQLCRTKQLK